MVNLDFIGRKRVHILHTNRITVARRKIIVLCEGALTRYGKLTWESAHAWNLIILCLLIAQGITFIFMVYLSFYAIPLLIYDGMYNITFIP